MAEDYIRLTVETLSTMPVDMQEEVYNFVKSLKASEEQIASKKKLKRGSVLNVIGLGKSGLTDLSLNHDKYLYEEQ